MQHLKKEHRLFEELLALLESWLDSDREIAASRVQTVLHALHQGLIEHERIEHLVFESGRGSHPSAKSLKAEHEDISDLREIIEFLIDNCGEGTLQDLKPSLAQLGLRLKRHFRKEEDVLWPTLKRRAQKDPPARAEMQLELGERRLEALLREVS